MPHVFKIRGSLVPPIPTAEQGRDVPMSQRRLPAERLPGSTGADGAENKAPADGWMV
jgi:hypothetical protein